MPPLDPARRSLVRQWIEKAEADFSLLNYLLTQDAPYQEAIAFHAQRAAEKYLKAFLVYHQVEFTKIHDLEELLNLVETKDAALAGSLREAEFLSVYAVLIVTPLTFRELLERKPKRPRTGPAAFVTLFVWPFPIWIWKKPSSALRFSS